MLSLSPVGPRHPRLPRVSGSGKRRSSGSSEPEVIIDTSGHLIHYIKIIKQTHHFGRIETSSKFFQFSPHQSRSRGASIKIKHRNTVPAEVDDFKKKTICSSRSRRF